MGATVQKPAFHLLLTMLLFSSTNPMAGETSFVQDTVLASSSVDPPMDSLDSQILIFPDESTDL